MKVGILGIGSAGLRHALNANALGHDVLVYDPVLRVMPFPHTATATRDDLIEKADAVVVATPSECHLDDLLRCLAAGKPCLIEKPIALVGQGKAVRNLLELNRTATKPAPVAVGYNLRFHPLVQSAWSVIAKGILPHYASFVCCQYTDSKGPLVNGCINDWATHEIDLAMYLLGPLRLLDKRVDRFNVDLFLKHWETGCNINIHSDMLAREPVRTLTVVSEGYSLDLDLQHDPVTNDHYKRELEAFIMSISGSRDRRLASGEDGLAALNIAERASQ